MGYKALITLDLPDASNEQRNVFYETLSNEKWTKIDNLTTSWKASFQDGIERVDAIKILHKHLLQAKIDSKVTSVHYALQLDKVDVVISYL